MKTYSKTSLVFKELKFLFLDPSANTTGFSIYSITESRSSLGYNYELNRFGLFESPTLFNLNEAINRMYGHITCLVKEVGNIQAIVVEIPEVVYAGKASPQTILSRAASLMDTTSVAAMFYSFGLFNKINVATVKPREWQTGKLRPRKVSSKVWSLTTANSILAGIGSNRKLGTAKDENIADAIAMGYFLIPDIFSQQVLFY